MPHGRAYIQSTFNNTIITMTDLATATSGRLEQLRRATRSATRGSRKGTPFAAQIAAEDAAQKAMNHGMREVDVFVKGPGQRPRIRRPRPPGSAGLTLLSIRDVTPIPHNGCRPRKRRRG